MWRRPPMIHPPMKAPTIPTMMSTTIPKPRPLTTRPASAPAMPPMTDPPQPVHTLHGDHHMRIPGLRSSTAAGTFSDRRRLNSVRRVLVAMLVLALTACGSVKYGGGAPAPPLPELEYRRVHTLWRPLVWGHPAG